MLYNKMQANAQLRYTVKRSNFSATLFRDLPTDKIFASITFCNFEIFTYFKTSVLSSFWQVLNFANLKDLAKFTKLNSL